MNGMRKGIQYIGVLDYNRSNEPRVFVNRLNAFQFSIKSQEEDTFNIQEITAFTGNLINAKIKEDETLTAVTKYLNRKLFIFFIDRKHENKEGAIFPYVTEKPKRFNPKEPFAGIPVFTGKDETVEKEWNEERKRTGYKEWDLQRTYKNFEEFCDCIKKGKCVGEIYGSAKESLRHPFVLWREEERIYAVGPINKYSLEKKKGWTLEGDTKRLICDSDILEQMVYDPKINPTLAFVPLTVCKLLEETLENIAEKERKEEEERTTLVTIPVFASKQDPQVEEWNRIRTANGETEWNSVRGYKDYIAFKEHIIVGKTLGYVYQFLSDAYDQTFILWKEGEEFFAVGPITECLTAWRLKINPVHKIRIGKITNKKIYNPEENPTIAYIPVSVLKRIEEKLTEMKNEAPEPYISVPVFAAKDDETEKVWYEKGKEIGDNRFSYHRTCANFPTWKARVKAGKGPGSIYGFLPGFFKQSFVLWRQEEMLYVVGPVMGDFLHFGYRVEKIPLSEFTDKTVCDVEENPMLAHIPESVCEQIEKRLQGLKWRQVSGVRRVNASKAWKYRSIEWCKRR